MKKKEEQLVRKVTDMIQKRGKENCTGIFSARLPSTTIRRRNQWKPKRERHG